MPVPVSRTVSAARSPRRCERDPDLPLERELERVREQVENDLLPHVAIDEDRLVERLDAELEPQAGVLDRRPEGARQIAGQGGEIGGLVGGLEAPGLDAREVEQRVDQLEQPQPVAVHETPALDVGGRQRFRLGESVLRRPQHQGQRRPELVADVAEERRLGAIDLRQRLGAGPGLGQRAGVGDGRGDLAGDQLEEAAVLVVEDEPRADRGDQHAGRPLLARLRDGEHRDPARRQGPAAGGELLEDPRLSASRGRRRAARADPPRPGRSSAG